MFSGGDEVDGGEEEQAGPAEEEAQEHEGESMRLGKPAAIEGQAEAEGGDKEKDNEEPLAASVHDGQCLHGYKLHFIIPVAVNTIHLMVKRTAPFGRPVGLPACNASREPIH